MEYKNELLENWVGLTVIIEHATGPLLQTEEIQKIFQDPGFGYQEPTKHRTAVYKLLGYDGVGITTKTLEEGSSQVFMPWGAVLSIRGEMPDVIEINDATTDVQ